MDFNFSLNMSRNESIFQNIANDIRMSSERHLKFVLRTLYRLDSVLDYKDSYLRS